MTQSFSNPPVGTAGAPATRRGEARRCCGGLVLALTSTIGVSAWAQEAARTGTALEPLLQADGTVSSAWRFVGIPRKHADLPPTHFEPGLSDGVRAMRVSTGASYGTLVHEWSGSAPGALQWRWRLDIPLAGGKAAPDILTRDGDDAALKVCVMFDHGLERVPFVERTVLRIARNLSGERLPTATVCYVWDSTHPAGLRGANPYTRRVRFIALQGRSAPLQRWVSESRDTVQDFIDLFADGLPAGRQTPRTQAPAVTAVVIGADSDNTATKSTGWVSDLRWSRSLPAPAGAPAASSAP